jgi:two-component system cell cycle sensor histidine kinase/response regulator CckA
MSEPHHWATRRPPSEGRRLARSRSLGEPAPAILIAGIVHHIDWLHEIGEIERARWSVVVPDAVRRGVDLVVLGTPSATTDARSVIAELKRHPAGSAIPVLHLVPPTASCGDCGAELCLPAEAGPATLVAMARVLLRLRRAERRSTPPEDALVGEPSQRLLALGRLAGGIVHDFNNLLFVMTGHVELARRMLGADHPVTGRLAPVLEAAECAAALSRQLLAFGRRSAAQPRLVDVNAVVARLDPLLRRLIGDDVVMELRPGVGLERVRVDLTQMEQLLLNLALNARDAMPMGGRLTIETRDVEIAGGTAPPAPPGRYVMLAVSDEGVGMDAETRKRVFEPFFTTKPEGEGSGLGLATVHDVVQQAGGSIRVDSEPGLGTTFRIYLPCAGEAAELPAVFAESPEPPGGTETVLVAEDSEPVREVTRELLRTLGYTVLTASGADEALAIVRSHPGPIDLLLTDVVMPGTGGGSLAEQVVAARPQARVLFMSGFGDAVDSGVLSKPFDQGLLARAVRSALDRARGEATR